MTRTLPLLTTPKELQAFRLSHPQPIALVPTMGNLHAGHIKLIQQAKALADIVVVSIFVNPTQFAPTEDFNQYPRTLAADMQACQTAGATAILTPDPALLYPMGTAVADRFSVRPPDWLTHQLCGLARPTHFEGVATVVLKLFNWVQPTYAIFGEKDAQQLAILRWMVADLGLPVELIEHPIVRQADGLALSSRNQYLSTPEAKQVALGLSLLLTAVKNTVLQACTENPQTQLPVQATFQTAWEQVLPHLPASPSIAWDYWQAVDRETFKPQTYLGLNSRLLVAGNIGGLVRLIDNVTVTLHNSNDGIVNRS